VSRHQRFEKTLLNLEQRIRKTYDKTPLQNIGDRLVEMLVEAVTAAEARGAGPEPTRSVVDYVVGLLDVLPHSFVNTG
jgi:hypothetical protein